MEVDNKRELVMFDDFKQKVYFIKIKVSGKFYFSLHFLIVLKVFEIKSLFLSQLSFIVVDFM
jgi:hypothetical protein